MIVSRRRGMFGYSSAHS